MWLRICKMLLASIFFAILFTGLILLPDLLFKYFVPQSAIIFDQQFAPVLFLLGLLLSINSNRKLMIGVLVFMFILQLIDLWNYAYFGGHIAPFAFAVIGSEASEIFQSGLASIGYLYFVPLLLIACYSSLYFIYKVFDKYTYKTKLTGYLAIALFFALPIKAVRKDDLAGFLPTPTRCSIFNGYRSFSYAIALPFKQSENYDFSDKYQPVTATFTTPKANNVILIMGESCNPEHMSLFGYKRNTTPLLKELASDPNFFKTIGLSSSVITKTSLSMFFSLMREPGHQRMLLQDPVGLFKIAKQQGYKTFWISAQEAHLLYTAASRDIDVFITNDGWNQKAYKKRGDLGLIDLIEKQELGEKNFIVLHQRTPHSPYEECYKFYPEFNKYPESKVREEDWVNKYDNAVHFWDHVSKGIIDHFKNRLKDIPDTYIFFTSDHSESLGEGGRFGHGMLMPVIFNVPIFAYAINPRQGNILQFASVKSHYELGKIIADLMGARINNPNEKDGEHFIHQKNIFGNNEVMRVIIDSEGKRQYGKSMSVTSYHKKGSS